MTKNTKAKFKIIIKSTKVKRYNTFLRFYTSLNAFNVELSYRIITGDIEISQKNDKMIIESQYSYDTNIEILSLDKRLKLNYDNRLKKRGTLEINV